MAGGTGGHVFPGLAVAKVLQAKGLGVHWLGTKIGLEQQILKDTNIPLHVLSVRGIRGKGLFYSFVSLLFLIKACFQALKIFRQIKPKVVLGMGGYVSAPGALIAWLLRVPLVLHEQNSVPGTSNRCLARLSKTIFTGFPGVLSQYPKTVYAGNPIRANLQHLKKGNMPATRALNILVLGGSRGAVGLNTCVSGAVTNYPQNTRIQLWHQTGELDFQRVQKIYQDEDFVYKITPFIENIEKAYVFADLVIARAGALTIAELMAVGLPSILVPFPFATDDHQTTNALFLVNQGAAKMVQEKAFTHKFLHDFLDSCLEESNLLPQMAKKAKGLFKQDAEHTIAQACFRFANQ